jgi:hypothetical protein
MVDITRLTDALTSIKRVIGARTDVSRFEQHVKECQARFEREKTFEAERDLILARVVREKAAQTVAPDVYAKMRYGIGGEESALNELFRHNSKWREPLRAACVVRLEMAEAEAKEVEAAVREEWAGQGFTEKQILEHPRLARAKRQVAIWKASVDACDNDPDSLGVWKRITRNLNAVA